MMARTGPLMQAICDFTGGPPTLPGGSSVSLLDGAGVALRGFSTRRGRQYELDVVQAGELNLDLTDPNELLNPTNTGSAWNSGGNSLLPYRCLQLSAWWNPTTSNQAGNWMNGTNMVPGTATVPYDPSFESGIAGLGPYAGTPTVVSSSAQHFAGAKSAAVTFNTAADVVLHAMQLCPGRTYTLSLYVFVAAGHTVTASWRAYPFTSSYASVTSSTTGAWQRLTLTASPTVPIPFLYLTSSASYPTTMYVDAIQLELGASASAFTLTGPTCYPIMTGYVERYPQQWDMAGFRGLRPLVAVDALSPLSRIVISQSYAATVLADSPAIFIPWNDDAAPQTVERVTGGQPMVGYTQLGSNSGAVNFAGATFLDGSKAVSVVQQNTQPVTFSDTTQLTYVGTRYGGLSANPQAFTLEMWVNLTSGLIYGGAGAMTPTESTVGEINGIINGFMLYSSSGTLAFHYIDPNGSSPLITISNFGSWTTGRPDGVWHYIALRLIGSNQMTETVDNATSGAVGLGFTPLASINVNNLYMEAQTFYGDPISEVHIANWGVYNGILTLAQMSAHYQRGIGYLGEMSGTRAARLLTKYWSTAIVTDTGKTIMAADFSYNTRQLLDVLQEIADTESGLCWADARGLVHQDSRETRYLNSTSSVCVFGENYAGGELPYLELEYDYDPTYVYSEADLSSGGTGNTLAPVINATSQAAYGQRILNKTLQMQYDWDVQQAGAFYVQRYAKPAGAAGSGVPPRISKLSLDLAANPALYGPVLGLDIGSRVTVKRRTSAGVTVSGGYYIEQINHNADASHASWTVDLQLSPVFVPNVWICGDATKSVLGSTTVCVY
jgi:hypothetical protein